MMKRKRNTTWLARGAEYIDKNRVGEKPLSKPLFEPAGQHSKTESEWDWRATEPKTSCTPLRS
jgi:hypothetical protein